VTDGLEVMVLKSRTEGQIEIIAPLVRTEKETGNLMIARSERPIFPGEMVLVRLNK
jgi:hypothetical protein